MDVFVSLALIILLSPVFIFTSLAIKLKLGKPIFFKQRRSGLHGTPFCLYKFRTMTNERDINGNLLPDQERLNDFGLFLRKYSLDEIPQFFNVLKGDMSLIGPRPLLMEYLDLYTKEQSLRHRVKPGITGWAQINGRNALTWEKKFELDTWYVRNHSFLIDCKIFLITIIKVIKREGISSRESITMEKFQGSKEVL
ncbi:sugar transferase [Oceanobacillus halophilus]|uniref:Sugar transferase n=2 Tax=Oceanobacillus halophilus TaxID=930130 RepID=A0A495A5A7_9BACI|nr:sugar transferase [Oceanobacillus halophilus]